MTLTHSADEHVALGYGFHFTVIAVLGTSLKDAKNFAILYKLFDRLADEGRQRDILSPVFKFMEKNLSRNDLSNGELAALLNISEVYFRRLFKEKVGITPHKYLLSLLIF